MLRAAIRSYFRSFYEVLALPAWSATEIRRRISVVNEHVLRDAYAGSGAVVAVPHSGNWDLAGAWATRPDGQAMLPMVPGEPRQREFAFRAGVNIVMYTLTGNYKADQVHAPALIERLGQ